MRILLFQIRFDKNGNFFESWLLSRVHHEMTENGRIESTNRRVERVWDRFEVHRSSATTRSANSGRSTGNCVTVANGFLHISSLVHLSLSFHTFFSLLSFSFHFYFCISNLGSNNSKYVHLFNPDTASHEKFSLHNTDNFF